MKHLPLLACFALGACLDFAVYGVAEIAWAVVYVPLFVAAASILHSQLLRSPWKARATAGTVSLLVGIAAARLSLVNLHREVTYQMVPVIGDPVTLHAEGARTLVVSSAALQEAVKKKSAGVPVPVVVAVTTDYGCISSFLVNSVAGVEIQQDHHASWTWRAGAKTAEYGPGLEDQRLPWCRYRLYRKS